jgi:GABA permease
VALLIGMVIVESTRESLLLSLALAAVVVAVGVLRYRRQGATDAGLAAPADRTPVEETRR